MVPIEIRQTQVTYFALQILFQDSRDQIIGLFKEFESNRIIISKPVGNW